MAKETNKSNTIILLVVAGVLLFLVGSFTGQIWKIPKLPKTPTPTTETGLTTEQKQDDLAISLGFEPSRPIPCGEFFSTQRNNMTTDAKLSCVCCSP